MHDDLKWNKVFGTVLATSLAILLLRQGSEMAFAVHAPKKPGYAIAVQETSAEGGGAEADTPVDWGTVLPTADVAAGKTVSTKCQSCHNFDQGGPNQTGPNLWGVVGRKPGSHPGFAYSSAMTEHASKDPIWNDDAIYNFLKGPTSYIAGTKMSFVGLKKREDRIDVIAYLRTLGAGIPVPAPDPARAAAGAAPANAAGSAPAPDTGTTVPAKPGDASAPAAVNGPAPVNGQTTSPGGVTPSSGAAAAPSEIQSTNPGGPPLAGTTLGGSKALAGKNPAGSGPAQTKPK